ncbi:hypothetical protein LSH36_86g04052 [Paralvinella palmiformis]|uniref:Uncharacterized protein n=1 Tax=Paralvinella palmiformis TaxID=53620 RepID=A0AAD9NC23_9ANNE|nr:hypothetical protein LSH36_86g04052 [Paralvinella palmiformis]
MGQPRRRRQRHQAFTPSSRRLLRFLPHHGNTLPTSKRYATSNEPPRQQGVYINEIIETWQTYSGCSRTFTPSVGRPRQDRMRGHPPSISAPRPTNQPTGGRITNGDQHPLMVNIIIIILC